MNMKKKEKKKIEKKTNYPSTPSNTFQRPKTRMIPAVLASMVVFGRDPVVTHLKMLNPVWSSESLTDFYTPLSAKSPARLYGPIKKFCSQSLRS